MNKELKTNLRVSIHYFLTFSDYQIPIPDALVFDKDDKIVNRIILEHAVTEDMTIEDATILANELSFTEKEYAANLCHELAHLIIYYKNPHHPTDSFLYLLKNEISADMEGLKLFVRSGRRKKAFLVLFSENFLWLFKKLCSSGSTKELWKYLKSMIINLLRLVAFTFYAKTWLKKTTGH